MSDPVLEIATMIELYLVIDAPGAGYFLTEEDQRIIIDCLRASTPKSDEIERLQALVQTTRKALEEVSRIPHMPFPDPTAHSWHATGLALHKAWFEIQQIVGRALNNALSSDHSTT